MQEIISRTHCKICIGKLFAHMQNSQSYGFALELLDFSSANSQNEILCDHSFMMEEGQDDALLPLL